MIKERHVFVNGAFVPESEAKISIYDSALMFGDMVFEMTRSFNKRQFKLRDHLERLYASIKYVRIPLDMSMDQMEKHIYETMEMNDPLFEADDEHRIMIDVTRGALSIYHGVNGIHKTVNVIISDFPLRWTVRNMGHLFDTGINAVIPSQRAIPASLLEPKVKNRSRIHYLMANIEVSKFKGEDNWALLLDPDGFIAEGTGDNFFIVKDKTIVTPEGRNILRGISRAYVFELAEQLNLKCIEKNIEPYDVMVADEAFMTGTPFCILPVSRLNGVAIGNARMGDTTLRLLRAWGENVGLDIIEQIQRWDSEVKDSQSAGPSPYSFS
ncbi:aminotransferase class IV [candidate division KSB1 bacterium]|nr:aminotransferase class IV [candidate division KSB1 bacterium]